MGIAITDENRPVILAALFNAAKSQGLGLLHYQPGHVMTPNEDTEVLTHYAPDLRIDYLEGRVMKVNLWKPTLDTYLYNRDNGLDAAETAITDAFPIEIN